jgi:hypothetical protein
LTAGASDPPLFVVEPVSFDPAVEGFAGSDEEDAVSPDFLA